MSLDFRSACDQVSDAIFSFRTLDVQVFEGDAPRQLFELVETVARGDVERSRLLLLDVVSNLKCSEAHDALSYFSRSLLKRLALHRVPKLDGATQGSLIVMAHELHATLCHEAFRDHPPAPLPIGLVDALASAATSSAAGSDLVVLLMVTRNYLENLRLWLDCAVRSKQDLPSVFILNFDAPSAEIREMFEARKVRFVEARLELAPFSKSGNGSSLVFIWYLKVFAALKLLQSGVDVIYSDLDSFWLEDVDHTLRELPAETSVSFMLSDNMPMISSVKFGVTCGCGFFFARSNSRSQIFFDQWLRYVGIMLDDQIGLAQLLLESQAEWTRTEQKNISWIARGLFASKSLSYEISVLSREVATRTASVKDVSKLQYQPIVAHPRWVKEAGLSSADYLELLFQRQSSS